MERAPSTLEPRLSILQPDEVQRPMAGFGCRTTLLAQTFRRVSDVVITKPILRSRYFPNPSASHGKINRWIHPKRAGKLPNRRTFVLRNQRRGCTRNDYPNGRGPSISGPARIVHRGCNRRFHDHPGTCAWMHCINSETQSQPSYLLRMHVLNFPFTGDSTLIRSRHRNAPRCSRWTRHAVGRGRQSRHRWRARAAGFP